MPQDTTITLPGADINHVSQESIDSLNGVIASGNISDNRSDFQKKSDYYSSMAFPCAILLLLGIWLLVKWRDGNNNQFVEIGSGSDNRDEDESNTQEPAYLRYNGNSLKFQEEFLIKVLNKRFPYFEKLPETDQQKFLHRLCKFIETKVFLIHDASGFKEMPILISAAAIQLSMGLEKYLLPNFIYINIYPQDFLGTYPTIRFLEGNVSGNSINISWKHFLLGFQYPSNGENVGLHEMAHAYYFQNFECTQNIDDNFVKAYPSFDSCGNKVFQREHEAGKDFYSEYAMKNFQEFWAESIEIFFEKPRQMKTIYPDLYKAIRGLLNQDPSNTEIPEQLN